MAKRVFNFNTMSLTELQQLREEIEGAFKRKIAAERKDLQMKIDALSVMEGQASKAPRSPAIAARTAKRNTNGVSRHPLKGRKATAKYRGPSGETWAGRGLMPRWLVALEKKGKKREQFLIGRSA